MTRKNFLSNNLLKIEK